MIKEDSSAGTLIIFWDLNIEIFADQIDTLQNWPGLVIYALQWP